MRYLLYFMLLPVLLLGILWLAAENWLAGRVAEAVGQSEDITIATSTPLRQIDRIGMRLDGVEYQGVPDDVPVSAALPWAEIWAPPTAPNHFHLTLPDELSLMVSGLPVHVALSGPQMIGALSPLNGMAVGRAVIGADEVRLNGVAAIEGLLAEARLASLGADAPQLARAAYDLDLRLDRADPLALADLGVAPLVLPGMVSANGNLRVWLTAAPGRGVLRGEEQAVQLVGWQTRGVELRIGDLEARLVARVTMDKAGQHSGRLALYAPASSDWLHALADAGVIAPSVAGVGNAVLRQLSELSMEPAATDGPSGPHIGKLAEAQRQEFTFPDPIEGELRLPIFLRDGNASLGAFPIGPIDAVLGL